MAPNSPSSVALPSLDGDDFERRFALLSMVAGALCSTFVLGVVALTDLAPNVVPGAMVASGGCAGALVFARSGRWRVGVRCMMVACALAIGAAAAMEPSGEAALTAALCWMLMGVFGSLLLKRNELVFLGLFCTAGTAAVVGWVQLLGVAPNLQPGGLLAAAFVGIGYAALVQIASYFRDSLARVRAAEHAARDALHARDRFVANMSHELRTPLNVIIGYSELLLDETVQEEAREDLQRIHWSGTSLLEQINAMLDLSKLEAGQMRVHLEVVDVLEIGHELLAQHHPLVGAQGNTSMLEIESGLMVRTDRQKLLQVLTNLLTNANKFTQDGTITLRGWSEAQGVVLEVVDTGIGMNEEALLRVFRPFIQADSSTTRAYGGTGLGLALVTRFVDLLGGEVQVESREGAGSTFRIVLPDPPGLPTSAA